MNQSICDAIRNRKVLRLVYGWGHRIVEPHAYGINEKDHELLRCFQTSGESKSNEPIGWKIFRVDEINQLSALDQSFASARPGYKRGDPAMSQQIYCQL
jgi:hypothetical protein